jgi:hypothetical protein
MRCRLEDQGHCDNTEPGKSPLFHRSTMLEPAITLQALSAHAAAGPVSAVETDNPFEICP